MLKRNGEDVLRYLVRDVIDGLPHAQVVPMNFRYSGPIGGLVLGQLPWFRINSERKELVEFRVECLNRRRLADEIPIEGLEVTDVE